MSEPRTVAGAELDIAASQSVKRKDLTAVKMRCVGWDRRRM
jgi:hypothetical protein